MVLATIVVFSYFFFSVHFLVSEATYFIFFFVIKIIISLLMQMFQKLYDNNKKERKSGMAQCQRFTLRLCRNQCNYKMTTQILLLFTDTRINCFYGNTRKAKMDPSATLLVMTKNCYLNSLLAKQTGYIKISYQTAVANKVALAAAILVVFILSRNSLLGELKKI